VGAAATGLRPVAELMFIDFLGVCFDQLLNNAAKMRYMFGGKARIPLTVLTHYGAGINAAAQHSQSLYAVFVHVPGLKVVVPSDAYTAKGLLIAAIRDDDPVIFCNHKVLLRARANVPEEPFTIPIGQAQIKREGSAVSLIACGRMTNLCLQAAEELAKDGIEAEVVDLLSLSPLDEDTILSSVRKTKRAVVVDEATPRCGLAADLAALIGREVFDYLDAPVQTVTAPHTPVPFSPALEKAYLPNPTRIAEAARSVAG
ncbi:MAG TPA: transketolase C-terminal domain-containing protein, partial [Dehalococcoidia bacterium]|nr:transketolase C-terminal domain-containing protein [Dehalococcoidia bacterium]